MASSDRPLSPHLQVYRPQLTSILSITHRATGVALAFGALLLSHWIIAATYGADTFQMAQDLLASWFGRLVLLGLTFSLFFHLGNGIRHLAWDIGWGFELDKVRLSGWTVIAFSLIMTVVTFLAAYAARGGA
jgi:succinate dehydrogenase / fumarate reductase cytochrome b subunit